MHRSLTYQVIHLLFPLNRIRTRTFVDTLAIGQFNMLLNHKVAPPAWKRHYRHPPSFHERCIFSCEKISGELHNFIYDIGWCGGNNIRVCNSVIKSNPILFRNNKITFYISKQQEQYCYVVVTWHILCRLPVTPKHKLRNYIYIYIYIYIYTRIHIYI